MKLLIQEAVTFIKRNLIDKGEIFVAFSGGKDSIVTAKLMELAEIKHKLVYSFTGIDPPEVVKFIRQNYPQVQFVHPNNSFWYSITTYNPPTILSRWCCTLLKKDPAKDINYMYRVLGIRSEESPKRSKLGRRNFFRKRLQLHYYPIYYWKAWQVWEFIDMFKLAVPSLYNDMNIIRIGCVICPFHSNKTEMTHNQNRKKWPKFYNLFEKTVEKAYIKRVGQGKKMFYPSSKEYCENWYKNSLSYWYVPKK